jgi:hypothetical protein
MKNVTCTEKDNTPGRSAQPHPPASGQRNAGRWLAGARFLQVLNEGHFGMREGAWQG